MPEDIVREADASTSGTLRCFIDKATTEEVHGWIQDQADPHLRRRVSVFIDDVFVESFIACRFRQDLQEAGVGDGCYAFEYYPPPGAVRDGAVLRLKDAATGREFAGSPVALRRPADAAAEPAAGLVLPATASSVTAPALALARPRAQKPPRRRLAGAVLTADWHGVSGWVADLGEPAACLTVAAFVDGRPCGTARADLPATAEAARRIGDGAHGFSITFEPQHIVADGMEVRVMVEDVNAAIPSASPVIASRVEGGLDRCDDRLVRGWAVDWNDLARKLTVEIFVNGTLAGEAVADRARDDLRRHGIGDGACGFLFKFPAALQLPLSQDVSVRAMVARTGVELQHSPWWVCRAIRSVPPLSPPQAAVTARRESARQEAAR